MKDFLMNYGLFFSKTLTVIIAVSILIFIVFSLSKKAEDRISDQINVKNLNQKYRSMTLDLKKHLLDKKAFKKEAAEEKDREKADKKDRPRVFVLNFKGDVAASRVNALREEITAVLSAATDKDEVVLRMESVGGFVHSYGLAASQLQRIKIRGIPLTVSVDKIAASGGYMMACVADRLVAAPFAIIGSIGVVFETPNFHRLLKKNDIDYEQITAGEYKRTVSLFGETTEEGRNKVSERINEVHGLFKQFVSDHRREVNIDRVATGEYWYASQALDLHLVDELTTSDDLLLSRSQKYDIYEVSFQPKKSLSEKISSTISLMINETLLLAWQKSEENRYK
jgi:serine protease SohB